MERSVVTAWRRFPDGEDRWQYRATLEPDYGCEIFVRYRHRNWVAYCGQKPIFASESQYLKGAQKKVEEFLRRGSMRKGQGVAS